MKLIAVITDTFPAVVLKLLVKEVAIATVAAVLSS
jgi:hypothetical protein